MKKLSITLLLCLCLQGLLAQESASGGSSGKFGLGLTLLGPTGITGKYKIDEKLSAEGSFGFGSFDNGRFHIHGVLLYDLYKINDSLSLYGGGGLVIEDRHSRGKRNGRGNFFRDEDYYDNSLGIRAPVGLSWKSADKKFELSAEAFLNLFLTGKEGANIGIALAGRYYF